ncbi:hypothetical protein BaRGS_00008226, partial [Batillaria attramentaria]
MADVDMRTNRENEQNRLVYKSKIVEQNTLRNVTRHIIRLRSEPPRTDKTASGAFVQPGTTRTSDH